MELRIAETTDAPAIAVIHRTSRAAAMPWLPVVHTPEEDLQFFRHVVLPAQDVWVATVSGRPAGFIAYTGGWLNHLYIAPEHWRAGLGLRLLSKAKADSESLQLWTFQGNTQARSFYARQGFEEVERTDGATNEEEAPDVRLVWRRSNRP